MDASSRKAAAPAPAPANAPSRDEAAPAAPAAAAAAPAPPATTSLRVGARFPASSNLGFHRCCALARHETAATLQDIRVSPDARRAASPAARERSTGNDKPTGLDHAGLDAGGARLRRARLGLVRAGRPPQLPGADAVYQFLNVSDLKLTHATQEGITLRVLLSRLLNCQPMRVSKKYSGAAPRGNQTSGRPTSSS